MEFKAGDVVEIMERGEWIKGGTVLPKEGRTSDHLVIQGKNGVIFEHYADEFNTRHDPNVKVIPLTLSEYNRIVEADSRPVVEPTVEWPASPIAFTEQELTDVRNRFDIHALRVNLRESGALPFNGVTIVERESTPNGWESTPCKPMHECVTLDHLWVRMAPSLEIRNEDGNIPSYSEFEGYALDRSFEEFPDTHRFTNKHYCDSCNTLRLIWLRYQLTAAIVEITNQMAGASEDESYYMDELRTAIHFELQIAEDPI